MTRCVKGIVFLTFWQGFLISILVKSGVLKSDTISSEHLGVAVQDALICLEMPLFAVLHLYAFDHRDYISESQQYAGRLPFAYALRDSLFGFRDVFGDSLTTLHGTGISCACARWPRRRVDWRRQDVRARRGRPLQDLRQAVSAGASCWQ